MLTFSFLSLPSSKWLYFLDAFLLVVLLFPALYIFMLRPMTLHIDKYKQLLKFRLLRPFALLMVLALQIAHNTSLTQAKAYGYHVIYKIVSIAGALLFLSYSAEAGQIPMSEEKTEIEIKPKVAGYVEGWYRSDESDLSTQTSASKKVNNEFRVRRARINVKGQVTEEISYRLQGSFDGPSPASGSASVRLWDGYMTYKALSLINITMGQFKYPFTLEGLEGIPDIIPVLRADSITDIAGKLGTQGGSYRDIGVMVNGGYKDAIGLTYGVAIINGKGINTGDNNRGKDIVGRVTLSPFDVLTLGGSYYRGKGQDETESLEVNESAYGAEAEFVLKDMGLSMRGEYLTAEWENYDVAQGKAVSGKRQKPNGWYIQAAYRLPVDLQLMTRYEDYEKDSNTPDSHLKTTTVGVTYYFKGKTRITANYLIRDAQGSPIVTAQETDAAGHRIGNLFLIQALAAF